MTFAFRSSCKPAALAGLMSLFAAPALATGLPIYTSAPTDVTLTNYFGPFLEPTDTVSINASGVFAAQQGGGDLVGDAFTLQTLAELGPGGTAAPDAPAITFDGAGMNFFIDRPIVTQAPGEIAMMFPVFFPVASSFTGGGGVEVFRFDAPFEGYDGPDGDAVVELLVTILYAGDLPTKSFTNVFGDTYDYVEGVLSGATIVFSRLDGPPAAAVPLPAALPLTLGAFGLLFAVGRRRRAG